MMAALAVLGNEVIGCFGWVFVVGDSVGKPMPRTRGCERKELIEWNVHGSRRITQALANVNNYFQTASTIHSTLSTGPLVIGRAGCSGLGGSSTMLPIIDSRNRAAHNRSVRESA